MDSNAQLNALKGQAGYHEGPNNANKFGPWQGISNAAWCDSFSQWGAVLNGGYRWPAHCQFGYKGDAYCPFTENHAKELGIWRDKNVKPLPGWQILFDWELNGVADHIGTVVGVNSDGTIVTIEGNYHDSVQYVKRDRKFVRGFVALPVSAEPAPPTPGPSVPEEEDDMPIAFERVIQPGEKTFVSVPPSKSGEARWGQVWGSLGADNYDLKDDYKPTPCRVTIKSKAPASQGWYTPKGVDANGIAQVQSGRQFGWTFREGDEGVSIENHGTHPVSFLCEAIRQ